MIVTTAKKGQLCPLRIISIHKMVAAKKRYVMVWLRTTSEYAGKMVAAHGTASKSSACHLQPLMRPVKTANASAVKAVMILKSKRDAGPKKRRSEKNISPAPHS